MKKKKTIAAIVCTLLFVLAAIRIFDRCTNILRSKVHAFDAIQTFYNEKKDSLDVVFVGSSHAYHGISPMEIWHNNGITSYVVGSASQSIPLSYYLIRECIRTQHPKVVVLEAYGARYNRDYVSLARLHHAIDSIPYNKTKWDIFREFLPRTLTFAEEAEFIFPIIAYHERWNYLEEEDFKPLRPFVKGHTITFEYEELSEPPVITVSSELHDSVTDYFNRIAALCRENDTKLLVFQAPSAAKSGELNKYKRIHKKVNALKTLAQENGVPFLDFEELREELPFDYSTDFLNATHLNTFGAEKLSPWFGDYLAEHYGLEDHRNDRKYAGWDTDYKKYRQIRELFLHGWIAEEQEGEEGNDDNV